jgi:hypothetical protein
MQTRSASSCRAAAPCSALISSFHGHNGLPMTVRAIAQGRYLPFATPSGQLKRPSCRGCGKHGAAPRAENHRLQWQWPHTRPRRRCSRTPASASTQSTGVSVFPAGGCCMHGVPALQVPACMPKDPGRNGSDELADMCAGQSQAKVRLPAVWLSLTASEALDDGPTNDSVSSVSAI